MLLIWDFGVTRELSEKATLQQPHLPSVETLPMAPLLDIEKEKTTWMQLLNISGGLRSF